MARLIIKELARERGISQGKLARLADTSISTIQEVFRHPDTANVSLSTLRKIASALGVSEAELFDPEGPTDTRETNE